MKMSERSVVAKVVRGFVILSHFSRSCLHSIEPRLLKVPSGSSVRLQRFLSCPSLALHPAHRSLLGCIHGLRRQTAAGPSSPERYDTLRSRCNDTGECVCVAVHG